MFKTVEHTIATKVVDAGTFTVAYPTNRDAGFYRNAHGHKIVTETNDVYNWPEDFTLSFGTSNITVNWGNARTLEVGTQLWLELNEKGDNERRADAGANADNAQYRAKVCQTLMVNLGAPDTLDADGVCESQTVTGAGTDALINGALSDGELSTSVATFDVPRCVQAAWTNTAVLTITGTDEFGNTLVENSASGTSHTGKKAFKTITKVETSATITGLTVGTNDVLGLPVFVGASRNVLAEYQDNAALARFEDGKIIIPIQISQTDLLAGTAQQFVAPVAGYITGLRAIVQAAVTTGGAITVEANTVAVVGLAVTVADAAAAGTVLTDDVLKIATGLVAAGDDCTVTPAAAFATAGAVNVEVILEPTRTLNGTFVAGDLTEVTATTGDVRGTYDPAEVCNGSLEFSLLVAVEDPTFRGLTQFDG